MIDAHQALGDSDQTDVNLAIATVLEQSITFATLRQANANATMTLRARNVTNANLIIGDFLHARNVNAMDSPTRAISKQAFVSVVEITHKAITVKAVETATTEVQLKVKCAKSACVHRVKAEISLLPLATMIHRSRASYATAERATRDPDAISAPLTTMAIRLRLVARARDASATEIRTRTIQRVAIRRQASARNAYTIHQATIARCASQASMVMRLLASVGHATAIRWALKANRWIIATLRLVNVAACQM